MEPKELKKMKETLKVRVSFPNWTARKKWSEEYRLALVRCYYDFNQHTSEGKDDKLFDASGYYTSDNGVNPSSSSLASAARTSKTSTGNQTPSQTEPKRQPKKSAKLLQNEEQEQERLSTNAASKQLASGKKAAKVAKSSQRPTIEYASSEEDNDEGAD